MKKLWLFRMLIAFCALMLAGCATHFVAEYDKTTEDRLVAAYEKINRLYDNLAEATAADRSYEKFSTAWAEIATDVRVTAFRQKARGNNEELQKIMDRLLANIEKTRAQHRQRSAHKNDPYQDSLITLDRAQFEGEFAAAVQAELFKK